MTTEQVNNFIRNVSAQYFTAKQVCGSVGAKSTADRRLVDETLRDMQRQGLVLYDKRNNRYRKVTGIVGKAVFQAHPKGFGFLLMDEGDDLFVPASKTNGAFHLDTVLYRKKEGSADEAEILSVLSRGMTQVVGTYQKGKNVRFVLPDEQRYSSDIFVLPRQDMGAKNGQKVVAEITSWPDDNRNNPEGKIVRILGYPDAPNVDMLSVAANFGLSQTFGEDVMREALAAPQTVSPQDIVGRRDLRNRRIFTIDGEDAKDLDDAVSVVRNPDGTFRLGVHIADVSHYVGYGSALDQEAMERGTSVYMPQMVFPMLPTQLSNGICSLFAGVERLALSCEMTIDAHGKVTECDIFPSVINSCHRLTYTQVQALLDGDPQTCASLADIADDLRTMAQLAQILADKRTKRGNIEFADREVVFVQDEQGNVVDIRLAPSTFAHRLIEEFMIAANESVADYAQDCGLPFVYRVHAQPDSDKLDTLFALLQGLGISLRRPQQVHNSVLQQALVKAEQTPYFHLVNDVMLRTMQKARYSDVNSGHFGLASRCYCHFTSPIRRYPDLTVHRVLKAALCGRLDGKTDAEWEQLCAQAARQSNIREKLADEAERRADDVKRCNFAQRLVGQQFDARISGVTERGLFAELDNTVEGFVPVEQLGDAVYDPGRFCLQTPSRRYSLGDSVRICVASVNKQACKVDFDIVLPVKRQNVD